jgi:hypothetical protein
VHMFEHVFERPGGVDLDPRPRPVAARHTAPDRGPTRPGAEETR